LTTLSNRSAFLILTSQLPSPNLHKQPNL
jgi:hypothetical protein